MISSFFRTPLSTRRFFLGALLALSLVAVACSSTLESDTPETLEPGSRPAGATANFELETFEHGTFNLNDSLGKPVVINFWFPSCPPCAAEMPDLQQAHAEYGDQVQFVGIQQLGLDTADEGQEFLNEIGVTFPNIPDKTGEVWVGYNIVSFPTTLFLDKEHKIQRTWSGLITEDNLEDQIEQLLEA